jgi:hypothetical protein
LIRETDDGHVVVSYHAPDDLARRYGLTQDERDTFRVMHGIARLLE